MKLQRNIQSLINRVKKAWMCRRNEELCEMTTKDSETNMLQICQLAGQHQAHAV